jgi:hypothetical protein
MEKLIITYLDENGNESFEEYDVDSDVVDYVCDLEFESATMFGNVIALQNEIAALKIIIESYKILAGGKHPTHN